MYHFPGGWWSDLLAWCVKAPWVRLVVVPIAIGVMFWSPWTEIAPPELTTELPPECIPESMVSFTFDVGYRNIYTKALPVLEKYDFKATLYVATNFIGKPGYISKEELQELARHRWWIGSYTVSAPLLTELSPQELWRELAESKATLESWGFQVVDFASPSNYNESILAQIKSLYMTHRTMDPGLNVKPIDRYQLKSLVVRRDTSVEEVLGWIDRAREEKAWLILTFHSIDQGDELSYKSEDLEAIVRYVRERGFTGVCPFANFQGA
jgi:peptidoglycan/xylan/chitin deacetylase (PgdA/CDA1 family)